jgi:hypothetical protein
MIGVEGDEDVARKVSLNFCMDNEHWPLLDILFSCSDTNHSDSNNHSTSLPQD